MTIHKIEKLITENRILTDAETRVARLREAVKRDWAPVADLIDAIADLNAAKRSA